MTVLAIFFFVISLSCAEDVDSSAASENYSGTYEMSQTCDGKNNPAYNMVITPVESNEYLFQNLGNYQQTVKGTITNDSVFIPSQNITAGLIGEITIAGQGKINNNSSTLEIDLNILLPGPAGTTKSSNCTIIGQAAQ